MTRLEQICNMTAEEVAKTIIDCNITDSFCKSNCEWAESMETEQDESECLKCCVRWLELEKDINFGRIARFNRMNKIGLLPCPFCGAEAQFRRFGAGDEWLTIECTNPYGACCYMSMEYTSESERMLADKWNRRAKPMSDDLRKAIEDR